MIPAYVERTSIDKQFYNDHLLHRLPNRMFDAHQHILKKEFLEHVDPSVRAADWAAQCYDEMTFEDSEAFANLLFPTVAYERNALTVVSKGADLQAANRYLASLLSEGKLSYAMMTLDPGWTDYSIEKTLVEGGFCGIKPYPDLITGNKSSDVSIFECMPISVLDILNRNKKAMTLHIPRKGRLADPRNVNEIKLIHDQYPDIKMIIAHMGRCYSEGTFEEAIKLMGDTMEELTFDLSAVLNPAVLDMALEVADHNKLLWGTDLPVFMWHGRRRWTKTAYYNLARENFPWNQHTEEPQLESGYTFFLYEQCRNILDAIDRTHAGASLREAVFYRNSLRLFESARKGE